MSNYKIRKATVKDIERLNIIAKSWMNKKEVSGENFEPTYFEKCISEGDLPPIKNASKDKYQLNVIEYNNAIIGFFDLYEGYPSKSSVWISIFLIDMKERRKGHAKRVLGLIEETIDTGLYDNISIGVDLKNYSGLMFWTSNGFKEVISVFGDSNYSTEHFAVIALKKYLK
ncbi:GNAT family N-acetyltransferase [Mycoplasmatota bacterium zrk1]